MGDPNRVERGPGVESDAADPERLDALVAGEQALRASLWNVDPNLRIVRDNCRHSGLRYGGVYTFAQE